jgi:hypothetical protein
LTPIGLLKPFIIVAAVEVEATPGVEDVPGASPMAVGPEIEADVDDIEPGPIGVCWIIECIPEGIVDCPMIFIFIESLEAVRGKPGGPIKFAPSPKPPVLPIFPGPPNPMPPPILGLPGPIPGIFMPPVPKAELISPPSFLVAPR